MEPTTEETPKETNEQAASDSNADEQLPTLPQQEPSKKSKKAEDRLSKKDDKNVEIFMKSFNSVPTLEEKLSLVCKKYVQTADDNKKLHFYIKQSDKRSALLQKSKEQLQHELNKTVLVKSKLENLCRELQKQNKAIKEESLLKIREEEERRKETQAKFQSTLTEITTLLQQNNDKNSKLRDDNISMSEKFKSVVKQYQLREEQVDKMAKQMELESQLSDAKLQKASLEHQAERERIMAEFEQMKVTVAQARAKILEQQSTEQSLRGQLAVYTDKYDEFQGALTKSNQLFGGFKEQMEKMSKKIKKLEKESLSWKQRWETSQTALLDMCSERQASDERTNTTNKQLQHMQGLCRTLQAERTLLLAALKENNIERPPLPTPVAVPPPPAPVPQPANNNNAKVDAMAANCAQLRQSLAHLQSQLNVLTTNKEQPKEEPPKPEKTKKNKSKKNKVKAEDKVTNEVANKVTNDVTNNDKVNNDVADKSNEVSNETDKIEPSNNENKDQTEPPTEIDDKAVESFIEAIKNANISLCDLEVESGKVNGESDSAKVIEISEEKGLEIVETCNEEVAHIEEVKTLKV